MQYTAPMRWWWLVLLVACAPSAGPPATNPEVTRDPMASPTREAAPTVAVTPRPSTALTATAAPPRRDDMTVGPNPSPPQPPGATPAATTSTTSSVEREIAMLRARLRGCYNAALAQQPELSSSMRWKLSVDADGTVRKATYDCADQPPRELLQCVEKILRSQSLPREGGAYETTFGTCATH